MDAGHVRRHPAQGAGAAQGADADDDLAAPMQFPRPDFAHEVFEQRQIEAELGLDELGAGIHLLFQIDDPVAMRRHEGIGGGADEQAGGTVEFSSGGVLAAVAHAACDVQQGHRVEIEHRLGLGMIALAHVVAGEAQDVVHAQCRGA